MNWREARFAGIVIGGFVCLLFPPAGSAQYLAEQFSLDTYARLQTPIVHSFAKAVAYDSHNQRIYNTQVILAHQVADESFGLLIFNEQVTTEIGLANSTTGDLVGDYNNCYSARLAAHANAYNLHIADTISFRCMPPEPPRPEPPPKENCPIILDLNQDGFHLAGPDHAVSFDIDADGVPERIAWTQAGGDDAFLCLDRNHNGVIDNGSELFGYATPLSSGGPAKIGYLALAELDEPAAGGNRDGKVATNDRMFNELCAWVDRNHDGIGQREEVYTLNQVGIVALEYGYKTIHVVDSYGNLFRYISRVDMRAPSGEVKSWPTFDVIFAEE